MVKQIAVYQYFNKKNVLRFECVRYEDVEGEKDFRYRRPDPDNEGEYIWNLNGIRKIPYRLPEFLNRETVFIVQEEKDVDNLWKGGLAATCNPMGAGNWRPEYNKFFKGKNVVIIPNNYDDGWWHAYQIAVSLYESEFYEGISIKIVDLSKHDEHLPDKGDVSDYLEANSPQSLINWVGTTSVNSTYRNKNLEDLKEQLKEAGKYLGEEDEETPPEKSPPATLAPEPLPSQTSAEASKERAEEVERLKKIQFSPLEQILEIEKYISERIDNPYILTTVGYLFNSVVFDVFFACPVLSLSSPDPNCGKTNFLQILNYLDPNSWRVDSPTESVLFRGIESKYPNISLYTDEAEVLLSGEDSKLLQQLFRSGYKTGASIPRNERTRDDWKPKDHKVYCPKTIASIGGAIDALLTRCIQIPMKRSNRLDELIDIDEEEVMEETKTFNEALRAYAIQYKERLRALHKSKPLRVGYWKEFKGRDKELTTGILTNLRLARLIEEEQSPHSTRGKELEDRALLQLRQLITLRSKTAIEKSKFVGLDTEVVNALIDLHPNWKEPTYDEFFYASDVIDSLEEMQLKWTEILAKKIRLQDKGAAIAKHISRHDAIRDCRRKRRRKKFSSSSYDVKTVIETLLPNTHPELQQPQQSSQLPEKKDTSSVVDSSSTPTTAGTGTTTEETTPTETTTPEHYDNKGVNGDVVDVVDKQGNSGSQDESLFEDSQNTHIGGSQQEGISAKEKEELELWAIQRGYDTGKL